MDKVHGLEVKTRDEQTGHRRGKRQGSALGLAL